MNYNYLNYSIFYFFFNDTATTEIYTLSLHDALPICLIGPNCLGFMRPGHQVYATFSPAPGGGLVRPGRIGMVSQSGAFGAYAYSLARERGLGLSLWATTGNEADRKSVV